jgi:DNA-binding GntR family transcriptional regulator
VVEEPFKGVRVADPSPESILEVAAVRVALETLACQTLARHLDPQREGAVASALSEIVLARNSADALGLAEAHSAFHRVVVQSAENALLQQIWQWLEGHITLALTVDQIIHPDFDRMVYYHGMYLERLRHGSPDEISDEVERHIFEQALDSAARAGVNVRPP